MCKEDRRLIKKAYKIFFRSGLNRKNALEKIESDLPETNVVQNILKFINQSKRGII